MTTNAIRIPVEIDNARAVQSAKATGDAWTAQQKRVDTAVKQTGTNLQRVATGMTGALGAVTAGVAAQQQAWVGLSATILASFAAGGVIGGALAIGGAAIGFLTSTANENVRGLQNQVNSVAQEIANLDQRAAEARGVDAFAARLQDVDLRLNVLARKISETKKLNIIDRQVLPAEFKALNDLNNKLLELRTKRRAQLKEDVERELVLLRTESKVIRERLQLEAKADQEQNRLLSGGIDPVLADDVRRARQDQIEAAFARPFEDLEESLRRQNDLLDQETAKQRALKELEQEILALRQRSQEARDAGAVRFAETRLDPQIERRERLRRAEIEKRFQEPEVATEFDRFSSSVGFQLTNTISSSIVAGIREGGDAAQQVWEGFLLNLSGQLLNLGVGAGLNLLGGGAGFGGDSFGGFFAKGFADGGSFITAGGPALFATSERGGAPELVQTDRHRTTITPVEQLETGGGGVTINGGVNIRVDGSGDPRATARAVREEIARLQRSGRGRRTLGR